MFPDGEVLLLEGCQTIPVLELIFINFGEEDMYDDSGISFSGVAFPFGAMSISLSEVFLSI